jgi:iron complex transport system substrate-binding protein
MTISKSNLSILFLIIAIPLSAMTAPADGDVITGVDGKYQRIVSLAPNITEILFALDLGDRVAGVTRYCRYPAEARGKPEVGGYFDPNIEAIVKLEPDLVILLAGHDEVRRLLEDLGIECLAVANDTVSDILASIDTIGGKCGRGDYADRLTRSLEARMREIRDITADEKAVSVLMVVEREFGETPRDVYAAGKNTFLGQLIESSGGRNVLRMETPAYPLVSAEGIVSLDPDVIIELVPDLESRGIDERKILSDWEGLPMVRAVVEGRIIVLSDDYAVIPGPRFILLLEMLARLLHPSQLDPR